jgi:hypothetical protein
MYYTIQCSSCLAIASSELSTGTSYCKLQVATSCLTNQPILRLAQLVVWNVGFVPVRSWLPVWALAAVSSKLLFLKRLIWAVS